MKPKPWVIGEQEGTVEDTMITIYPFSNKYKKPKQYYKKIKHIPPAII